MRYIAAYMLLVLAEHEEPKKSDIKKVLNSVGVEVNEKKLDRLLTELKGKVKYELFDIMPYLISNSFYLFKEN